LLGGVALEKTAGILHYLYDSPIQMNPQRSNNGFFTYKVEEVTKELANLKNTLAAFPAEVDELYCWFSMDRKFNRRQAIVIENHLEKVIENQLRNELKINVLLIPAGENAGFVEYLKQMDLLLMPLAKRYPDKTFAHLIHQEGNGLLSQAFSIEAIRHFGERYEAIHWEGNQPASIQYEIQVDHQSWTSLFKTFIQDYDYPAARDLLKDLNADSFQVQAIEGLLQSQIKRMNFAFEEAYEYLNKVFNLLPPHESLQETASILKKLIRNHQQEKELERIVELFRQINIYIETDDIPSFLVRFYRAREAVLFYLMDHARTSDQVQIERGKKSAIFQVFVELEELYDARAVDGHYGAYFFLKSQNTYNILQYRNRSFIGHARNKIDSKDLWLSFAGTNATTTAKVKKRFQMDSELLLRDLGVIEDDNFHSINLLLLQLADGLTKKEVYLDEAAANL
jgi:hypothetical protein